MQKKEDEGLCWYDNADLIYWRPNRAGYTSNANEAGHYSLEEIADCAGKRGDWLIEPVWVK